MKKTTLLISFLFGFFCLTHAQPTTISEKTEGMEKEEGFFTYYTDDSDGKIWLEIDRFDTEFLYVNSLMTGLGSNDIGLDRTQLGSDRIVYFDRRGPKVLLVQPNYDYRAITDNRAEQRSVRDAFAESILWGFEVAAEEEGRVLVDATDFLLRDAHGVGERLESSNQGSFSVDESRSALYPEGTMNFPKNTEFEATLTLTGDGTGEWLQTVAPSSDAITVRQHHSFVELPDDDYEPRAFDPRAGYFGISFQDYSTPVDESLTKRFINRHRLEKKDPDANVSEPVEPITYYLDPGTPEPIRSALLDGARWWNEAFEAAGYENAFQVEMLPEDAHPLDVRYNVINWVHRSTRGWSYGSSVTDPRTGEIIKGHVQLGSLRVRQDYLIAEGLLAPYGEGELPEDDPMLEMALARIRQLSAHEIGHTLGISHNFAASVNGRASVMDYPHPKTIINNDGSFDLGEAYDTGIGEWDKAAVAYGYQDFPGSDGEEEGLNAIIRNRIDDGLLFISDQDARPQGGAHPYAHLWDYGEDPVAQLDHILNVREIALERFSEDNIKPGQPMAELEDVLVPIYLYHRYQIEGTSKLVGGVDYTYNLRGDGQQDPEPVDPELQRNALEELLKTLQPEVLRMPRAIIDVISPRPMGYSADRELFKSYTDPAFDPLGAAETAAGLTAQLLFDPSRAARLVDFEAREDSYPGLGDVIDAVLDATLRAERLDGYDGAIQRTVDHVVLYYLIGLAADNDAASQVRAVADYKLGELKAWLEQRRESGSEAEKASARYSVKLIEQYEEGEKDLTPTRPLSPPPGSPIGDDGLLLQCGL